MPRRLVVVGGDAAGMSAASQARRRTDAADLEITAFERSSHVSYSACGEPYYVAGYVERLEDLVARTPEEHRTRQIDVWPRHEVVAIDLAARTVRALDLEGGGERVVGFDVLMYATGAKPLDGGIEGLDLEGVHTLHTLEDAERMRRQVDAGVERAVVVGAGYIGLEVAEAFVHRGIPVTVVTSAWVMEKTLDPDIGEIIATGMRDLGIEVITGTKVRCLDGSDGRVRAVECDETTLPADIVVLGLGYTPEVALAEQAGIPLGPTGAVAVDERQRTRIDGVWSGGDCAEAMHRVLGSPVNIHLGTIANKQGRVAGINIGGGDAVFPGVLGTAITRVCGLEISRTGLTEHQAAQAGLRAVAGVVESTTSAGYWPEADHGHFKAVVEQGSGRLLGGQIVGGRGAAKRIDVIAAALWSEMTADDLAMADLSYAPPFSPVWDPVLIAARAGATAAAG